MKFILLISAVIMISLSNPVIGQEDKVIDDPNTLVFRIDSLLADLNSNDQRWMSFIKGANVLTGLYRLKPGDEDSQRPHDTDEVYYVLEGKAKLMADGKEIEVKKGSVVFVKALVGHRFAEIEEELLLLVFFDQ